MEWFDTEARRHIVEATGRFAQKELLAWNRDIDTEKQHGLLSEILRQAYTMGFLSTPLPEELGGSALDWLSETMLWEKLADGCAGAAALLATHAAGLHVLANLRDVSSVSTWLENKFSRDRGGNQCLVGVALPEAVVDLQRSGLPFVADMHEDRAWEVEGMFLCFPGPSAASSLIVFSPTNDHDARVFWMEAGKAERFFTSSYPGSGLEELPKGRLMFDRPTTVQGEMICAGERARSIGITLLARLRLSMAAIQIGNAHAAWRTAFHYATERIQTGRIIIDHQEVRRMLVHMETLIQAGRSLLYRAAACTGDLSMQSQLACMADRFCAEMTESVCLDAIQILGGYGYMKDYGLEKRLRDCKTLQALLGSYPVDWLGN